METYPLLIKCFYIYLLAVKTIKLSSHKISPQVPHETEFVYSPIY
uniref:Uncharacterized protein n=1 Tax=Arundo donax TaxID=35708 RepID=A0A0A9FTT7_ARUDO